MANIFLIGFMGTGKTTIANGLNSKYGMQIIDMDAQIEKDENMTIPDIFASKGETFFRDLETNLIKNIQTMSNVVISCGGGAVLREENVQEMKKSGKIILLEATPETILERVKNSHNRPLLEGNKNVGYIRELMGKREEKYKVAADFVVCVDDRTVDDIVEEIHKKAFS